MDYYAILGPLVRLLPPETAHEMAIKALQGGVVPPAKISTHAALKTRCFGLSFANPVGLAAGFDKNAHAVDALANQGFGFVEAGTVTPLPQPGNPQPRMFRLKEDEAVINRLGFNNYGLDHFVGNLRKRTSEGIIGANIGMNKTSSSAEDDYRKGLAAVYAHCDYITVNISSPNTAGLRDLQEKKALASLMQAMDRKRLEIIDTTAAPLKPILYKIAPDLTQGSKEAIVETAFECKADGLIVSNTTVSRPAYLQSRHRKETGGLSGKPLFTLSTETLKDIYRLSKGRIPLIGVGGIACAEDAYAKIKAGASLVQLYSALVYQGFALVEHINKGLVELLERDGLNHISDATGLNAK